ncbi:MAG: efflux RND transporter periplasmic adaptor subunit [Acidobacteria bacterium]|jgi:HlyD family secretion protein|nr:MAG: efflux RND transporter periplasmic adaptor subunit [Acidobacteriota bacterium]
MFHVFWRQEADVNGNVNGKKKRRKRIIIISVVVAAILLCVGVVFAFTHGGTKIDPSKLAKVEKGDLAKSVVATGKVEPITKVEVKSKASGIVKKLLVQAGDKVKKGQLLAQLDKEEIQAQVAQSQAALQAAEASLKGSEADYERAKVDAEGPDVPLLKRAYERAIGMAKEGVVSTSALEDAQKNYELSLNKQNVSKAQLVVLRAKIGQSAAQVSQDRANLKQLEEQLGYTDIESPIDGVVLSRDVEMGDAVSSILVLGSSATLVMTLGDTSEVYVKGKVDESDIGKVYLGQPARIKVESFKDKTFNGKVTRISPMGVEKDNVTTFEVRVSINNPGGELKAEMTANAEIILEEHKSVLQIPEGAILYDKDKKASVEMPDPKAKDGKKKMAVNIGISNGAKTEVLGGLKEGDQVVLQ